MMKTKPIKQGFAMLLSAALLLGQLPVAAAAEGVPPPVKDAIASFTTLPNDVTARTVPYGTELDALELPEGLTATVYRSPEDAEAPAEGDETPLPDSGDEAGADGGDAAVPEETQIPVTWESEPAYDGGTPAAYTFTADVSAYALADGVTPPEIAVTVEAAASPVCTCTEVCTAENLNRDCPVCGAEGAKPEDCAKFSAPNPGEARGAGSWRFVEDPEGLVVETRGGRSIAQLSPMENGTSFDELVKLLPKEIEVEAADGGAETAAIGITGWECASYKAETIPGEDGGPDRTVWPTSGEFAFTAKTAEGFTFDEVPVLTVAFATPMLMASTNPTVDITKGGLIISDGRYQQGNGAWTSYTGTLTITGKSTNSDIYIDGGVHDIVLQDAEIYSQALQGYPNTENVALYIRSHADVTLTLRGTSTLTGSESFLTPWNGMDAIAVNESKLTIQGDGTLNAVGGDSKRKLTNAGVPEGGAGIAVSYSSTLTISGGTVNATGGNTSHTNRTIWGTGLEAVAGSAKVYIRGGALICSGRAGIRDAGTLLISGGSLSSTGAYSGLYKGNSITVEPPSGTYAVLSSGKDEATALKTPLFNRTVWTSDSKDYVGVRFLSETADTYELKIEGGGDGATGAGTSYLPGQEISINAGTKEGYQFSRWETESGGSFGDATKAETTYTMPVGDATITPVFLPFCDVTVTNGQITGEVTSPALPGSKLTIKADELENKRFSHWELTDGDGTLANSKASTTTFTVGSTDATVTAVYIPLYALTVLGGGGSGLYAEGERVTITARIPSGATFTAWEVTGGTVSVADPKNLVTTLTMPDGAVTVTAQHNGTATNETGDFVVDGGTYGTGYTYDKGVLNFLDDGQYTVSMREGVTQITTGWIQASTGSPTITLRDVNIRHGSAFESTSEGNVTIKLDGENVLSSTDGGKAALYKGTKGSLTITSALGDGNTYGTLIATVTGSAKISAAAIGGNDNGSSSHITISGGTIIASSGNEAHDIRSWAAGIGGGSNGSASNIIVTGGNVTAYGGRQNAGTGIGAGSGGRASNILIQGNATIQQKAIESAAYEDVTANAVKGGTKQYVKINYDKDTASAISVAPKTAEVYAGGTKRFTATVTGANQTVSWSVSGNKSQDTTIDQGGTLTIGPDETADSLTVTAKAAGGDVNATATVTVKKFQFALTADKETLPFGEALNLTATVPAGSTGTVLFYLDGAPISAALPPVEGKAALTVQNSVLTKGEHTLTARFSGAGFVVQSNSVKVKAMGQPVTVSKWPTAGQITYGQALSDSALTGGEAGTPGVFTWTNDTEKPATGKHSYDVTFTPDDAGYETITGAVELTTNKAVPTLTWENDTQAKEYDSEPADVTSPVVTLENDLTYAGKITYQYKASDSAEDFTDGLPTAAGKYTVKAGVPEQENYAAAESDEMTLIINQRLLSVPKPEPVKDFIYYTGETPVELKPVTVGWIIDGDDVHLDSPTTGTVDPTPSSEYKEVVVAWTALTGKDAGNYTYDHPSNPRIIIHVALPEITITAEKKPESRPRADDLGYIGTRQDTIVLTATVKKAGENATFPTGTIVFNIDDAPGEPILMINGVATWEQKFTVGEHEINAAYTPADTETNYASGDTETDFNDITFNIYESSLGTVTLSGEAKFGETLTANIDNPDSDTFNYYWYRTKNGSDEEISLGLKNTYTLTEEDIGCTIFVSVYEDAEHDQPKSAPTGVVEKADGPAAPTGGTVDDAKNTFAFTAADGTDYEFSTDGGTNWNDVTKNPISVGDVDIAVDKLQVRVKETNTHKAGELLKNESAFTSPAAKHILTVKRGTDLTNSSPYATGTEVSIQANKPSEGEEFDKWTTSGGGTFADATSASTTFTMPAGDVTVTATYRAKDAVAIPVFKPAGGSYDSAQDVTLSSETDGVSIYYTTDGTPPTTSSTLYAGSIHVSEDMTIKAIAVKDGMLNSGVAEASYTITTPAAKYALTVQDGTDLTNSSPYTAGAKVSIQAGKPSKGEEFDAWTTSGGGTFADASSASTTFTMPAADVTVTATYRAKGAVATPVFAPAGGSYDSAQDVRLSSKTEGASIYYTTDGTPPTASSTLYAEPIHVSEDMTIKAIAVKDGMLNSGVAEASYTITTPAAKYALTVQDGTDLTNSSPYTAGAKVSIQAGKPSKGEEFDAWTTSGGGTFADASSASTTFTMPAADVTVTATYRAKGAVATPVFAPAGGSYDSAQDVRLSSKTEGASIYYTTDGTPPTASSTLYAEPIHVSKDMTIKAIAVKKDMPNSAVATAVYTITIPATKYTLTVMDGASAGGEYAEGASVALDAGTKTGYSFSKWTATAGAFASETSAKTTFTMPGSDATVTANWTKDSTGGGGGSDDDSDSGSSDSGSSSGSGIVTVVIPSSTQGQPDPATEGTITPQATVDKDGKVTVKVTDANIQSAIDKAQAKAKKDGTEDNGIAVVIDLTELKTQFNTLPLTLSKTAWEKLVKAGVERIDIRTPQISVSLDLDSMKTVAEAATGSVTILAEKADKSKLSSEAQKALSDRTLYDLTITSGDEGITQFDGSITISMRYTLSTGEQGDRLQMVYVDADGKLQPVDGSGYKAGAVTGETDHLTVFGVAEKPAESNVFTDVLADAWYAEAVREAVAQGLFAGTSDTTFGPEISMTRGMLVTVLHRMAGEPAATGTTFPDVAPNSYYAAAVAWASGKGIVSGYDNGGFGPDDAITREQLATILYHYAGSPAASEQALDFTDADQVSGWADSSIRWAVDKKLLQGSGDALLPKATATRAQVAAILVRFLTSEDK